MATNQGTIFLLAGAGALLLMAGKKKRRRSSGDSVNGSAKSEEEEEVVESDLDEEEEDDFEPEETVEEEEEIFEEISNPSSPDQVLLRNMGPDGKATLGKMYQLKPGDTPLEIFSQYNQPHDVKADPRPDDGESRKKVRKIFHLASTSRASSAWETLTARLWISKRSRISTAAKSRKAATLVRRGGTMAGSRPPPPRRTWGWIPRHHLIEK